jgi:hypothetical protein
MFIYCTVYTIAVARTLRSGTSSSTVTIKQKMSGFLITKCVTNNGFFNKAHIKKPMMLRRNNNSHEGVSSLMVIASAIDMITSKPWQTSLANQSKNDTMSA